MTEKLNSTTNRSLIRQHFLAQRLAVKGADESSLSPIPRRPESSTAPLSFAQERLWFLDQLEPNSPRYNMPAMVRLEGRLDLPALEAGFNHLIRRHETLRTTFTTQQGKPVQVIHAEMPLKVAVEDYSDLPEEEKQQAIEKAVAAEASQPFDLKRGPLIRAKLLRRGPEEQVLVVSMHHIIADGWSIGVLISEMGRAYEAEVKGEALGLAELPIQYGDYAVWQREYLQGEELARQLGYWKEQLKGAPEVMNLGTDRARGAVQSYRGGTQKVEIREAVKEGLKRIGQEQGATMYMVMMAGMRVMLRRYSGERDLVIGTAIANRRRKEVEGLIGFFVNSLAMRVEVGEEESYEEVLRREKEVAMGGYENQDVPFEKVVEEVKPERSLSYTPLFQVMFMLQNAPITELKLHGLTLNRFDIERNVANVDLLLSVEPTDHRLIGTAEYSTDLFDASTIARFLGHLKVLLEGIVVNPQRSILDLPLLTEAERIQLLSRGDRTGIDDSEGNCLDKFFEAEVEKNPNAIALSFKGETLSYSDLNAKSNRIANGLLQLSIGPNEPIAVMIDDSPQTIITLLGVLKARCFFVCLNPHYPPTRLAQVLKDAAPRCLIIDTICLKQYSDLFDNFLIDFQGKLIIVDLNGSDAESIGFNGSLYGLDYINAAAATNPNVEALPEEPAYFVYTSGSTGTPKGILQSHKSFCQFLQWQSKQFHMYDSKRIAQWASIAYDAAYCEIFGALCFGATLCLETAATKADPALVIDWVERERISLLQVVPSFCNQMLEVLDSKDSGSQGLSGLEIMLLAGEVLPVSLASAWLERFPTGAKLFNLYGPTECVLATYYAVEEVKPDQRSIPVGQAIDGRQILILDEHKHLCPIGIKGEVYVRSQYLTMGYVRRPEETAKVFIQNPLHNRYADPVYRVGDLARWLPDGNIELFGRRDHQVKIRGIRVELEDIEAVLSRHQLVSECLVIAHKDDHDQRLVAYVVCKQEASTNQQVAGDHCASLANNSADVDLTDGVILQLRNFLSHHLPLYMVPSVFIRIDSLPRTLNGKVNRAALPRPDYQHLEREAIYVAPRTPLEAGITDIWQSLLRVDKIGVQDNFFNIGGHSLLAAQVVNKLREVYKVDLPVLAIFKTPTISDLAEKIEAMRQADVDAERLAQLVSKIKQFSDDEIKALLQRKKGLSA